jgi:predicted MPP superfamily phosphohydrolase
MMMEHLETVKMNRRTFLKKMVLTGVGGILATTFSYGYARFIEPAQLTVTHHIISHPLIPKEFTGTKLLQFSDVHLGHYYGLQRFHHTIAKINELQPDIVVFTGDLLHEPNKYPHIDAITDALSHIRAPLGKFSIYGNHDHGGYGTDIYRHIMEKAGFHMLVNEHVLIRRQHGRFIAIAGSDDMMLGRPNFAKMVESIPDSTYTIVLLHEPDGAIQTSRYPVHLQLSGHSHGGQIQLPFIGPLITPPLSEKYYEGFYRIRHLTLYVNRGLGTTRVPLRFLSPPELTVFTLQHRT